MPAGTRPAVVGIVMLARNGVTSFQLFVSINPITRYKSSVFKLLKMLSPA
jgi:hypothetical protein